MMRIGKPLFIFCRRFLAINLFLSATIAISCLLLGKAAGSGYGIFLVVILVVLTAVGFFGGGSATSMTLPPEAQIYLFMALFIAYSIFVVFALYVVIFAPTNIQERYNNGSFSGISTLAGIVTAAAIWIIFFPALIKGGNILEKDQTQKYAQAEKLYAILEPSGGFKIFAVDGSVASSDCGVIAYNTPVGQNVVITTQHDENKMCPAFSEKVNDALKNKVMVEYRLPPKKRFLERTEINPEFPHRVSLYGKIRVNGEELPLE